MEKELENILTTTLASLSSVKNATYFKNQGRLLYKTSKGFWTSKEITLNEARAIVSNKQELIIKI